MKTCRLWIVVALLMLFSSMTGAAQDVQIEVVAPNGASRAIDVIDSPGEGNYLALYTSRWGETTRNQTKTNIAVQVNADGVVTRVVNKAPDPETAPGWQESPDITIPADGYVLLACDDSYWNRGYKYFLATNFAVGDKVKLRIDGKEVSLTELKQKTAHMIKPSTLQFDRSGWFCVPREETETIISGRLTNYTADDKYNLKMGGESVRVEVDGSFSHPVRLQEKTNYIDVILSREGRVQQKETLVIYRYMRTHDEREVILWIEQSTNANKYPTSERIRAMLEKARETGVTAVALGTKGHEGFAAYLRNDLSGIPHISKITESGKTGVPEDLDILAEYIRHCHKLGLKLYAVFNVFGSGSALESGLTAEQLKEFEEWVYRPEDGGKIVPLSQSNYDYVVHFLNPANDSVQEYQLKVLEEVLRYYDVDAIVLDRARYDNIYADFSPESKAKFAAFLAKKGKELSRWPDDVFRLVFDSEGNFVRRENGPLFYDWLAFRSTVTRDFSRKARQLVEQVNQELGKDVQFAMSLGSWYQSYYRVGQNWASPHFRYDSRLGFPLAELYTEEYAQIGFGTPEIFDFMMIGTYQSSPQEIKKYITLFNILTLEEFPVYAGMQLTKIPDPSDQREAFQAAFRFANGIKLFDLSCINWEVQKAAIANKPYVKTFQLGISIPADQNDFIEGDFVNQNRDDDQINVYTDAFGPTTGTPGSYGVEVVVDKTGTVRKVVNQEQALSWSWSGRQPNNSDIPSGGFVISAIDTSGTKTRRQLLAQTYNVGDQVRAAVLRGHLDYDGLTVKDEQLVISGEVQVLGPGSPSVTVDGRPATVDSATGEFAARVKLDPGLNEIEIVVRVDGMVTNRATVKVIRK